MASAGQAPPRLIARQLALGFGSVSVVSLVMGAVLLGIVHDVSTSVSWMRHDESSIRSGFELAMAVRELSGQVSRAVVEADASHLGRYEASRAQVNQRSEQLAHRLPEAERWRLRSLDERVRALDEVFKARALPAVRAGDLMASREAHRVLEATGAELAQAADAIAQRAESQMAQAHVVATDLTRLGLIAGMSCMLLVVTLGIAFTLRLRAAVLRPLVVLGEAARRFGEGDFAQRVGQMGRGELGALAQAFDRMAEEIAHREERLVQQERMAAIGQLAAGVAHELNNPIGIIRGYLKTMNPDGEPEVLREELAILDEEAAQCQRIAADLLSYARLDTLHVEPLAFGAFVEETCRRFRETPLAADRRIDVEVEDAEVALDPTRFRQVVLNLLTNAIQSSPLDAPVTVRGRRDGDRYCLEVLDRGPGVPLEDRPRVFEPFFSKRRGGSGLGLAVCLGIVRAHEGTIDVADAEGGGALLRVCVPLGQGGCDDARVEVQR